MISVSEDDRSAKLFQRLLRQRLNSRSSADRHKRRRLDHSMRRAQLPAPRGRRRILLLYGKRKAHALSVSVENPGPTYQANLQAAQPHFMESYPEPRRATAFTTAT